MSSIETKFLTKLLLTADFETVDKLQIKSNYFSGRYKKAFKWIQDFKVKYGKTPSLKEFKRKFSNIELEEEEDLEEPLGYYGEEVRSKVKHNTLVDALEIVREKLEELETDEAVNIIVKTVMKIQRDYIQRETAYLNEDAQKWKDAYDEASKSGGMTGIPIGIAPFDRITGGCAETDLITFLGYTGVGKSWLLIIISCFLVGMGYKVLFITREMGTKQILKRVHACMTRLPYENIKSGSLNTEGKKKYFKYLDKQATQDESLLVIESATGGVTNISSLVDLHQPEILMIDGGYLMTDDSDDKEWKGLVETWWGFKQIALNRKIPTFTNMQLKSGKASLDNIAMAKYISQYCDQMWGMEQDEQMLNDKELKMKPLKLRDAEMAGSFVIRWDFKEMDWSPVYITGERALIAKEGDKPSKIQKLKDED